LKPVNVFTIATETDPEDPPGYRAGAVKLAPRIGAAQLGGSVYDLPPGESVCPYHFEFGAEEWLVVVRGRPTLRRAAGPSEREEALEPGDTVCFPPGPSGAHHGGPGARPHALHDARGGRQLLPRQREVRRLAGSCLVNPQTTREDVDVVLSDRAAPSPSPP
jgi:quercetin dioxygenase-like cupin family protein